MPSAETLSFSPTSYHDAETGRRVTRWTDLASNDQLLYFTSPSHTADGSKVVFLSDSGGDYNIWVLDLRDGTRRRVSDNRDGFLRSYVYFDGNRDGRGLGRASVSLDAKRQHVYYVQGHDLMFADLINGTCERLASLPFDEVTAFTHISTDGRFVCVPTIHRDAFDKAENQIRPQVGRTAENLGIRSNVRIFDTHSGEETVLFSEPGWVTHVQFRPNDAQQVLYNHEWCDFSATQRLWLWNGYQSMRLRPANELVDARGTAVHEVWCRDGRSFIYHGHYFIPAEPTPIQRARKLYDQQPYVGRCYPDGDYRQEIALATGCHFYGHFMPDSAGGKVVSDGYYESETRSEIARSGKYARWITVFRLDWENLTAHPEPLCRHDSSWSSQDAHPHPVFAPDEKSIWFTSDREGKRAIYQVELSSA